MTNKNQEGHRALKNKDIGCQRKGEQRMPLFWCGSVLSEAGLREVRGESPAASAWSYGLLSALQNRDENIKIFSPVWDSYFPRGALIPGRRRHLVESLPQKIIPYINIPALRGLTISLMLQWQIKRAIRKGIRPKVLLNYNPFPHYTNAFSKVVEKHPDIPWVNVVLDFDDPSKDQWKTFLNRTKLATAHVFLSWWAFENAPVKRKLHLDGGWDGKTPALMSNTSNRDRTFVYTGTISDLNAIGDIVDAIKLCRNPGLRFEFYGKGEHGGLTDLAKHDSRVMVKGFVSNEELCKACQTAYAFLNPRAMSFHGTRMIFPSKIFNYLKYQKPVLSPWLPGFSPEYQNVIVLVEDASPIGWMSAINKVLNLSTDEHARLAKRISAFLITKTWDIQAGRLLQFVDNLNMKD